MSKRKKTTLSRLSLHIRTEKKGTRDHLGGNDLRNLRRLNTHRSKPDDVWGKRF